MSIWQGSLSGNWNDPARWDSGVPDNVGAFASIPVSGGGGNVTINLPRGNDILVGTLSIAMTGTSSVFFEGAFSGAGTSPKLVFAQEFGAALNFTSTSVNQAAVFRSTNGLSMELATDLTVNTSGFGIVLFDLPVSGTGKLIKSGASVFDIIGSNSFSGGIDITGGRLRSDGDAALGSGAVRVTNDGIFEAEGTIDNTIGTFNFAGGGTNSGTITAAFGQTLTLTGNLSHGSNGTLKFNWPGANSTIVTSFSGIGVNITAADMAIVDGTVRFGNSFSANALFAFPGSGRTAIEAGAVLDTAGFSSAIGNLDMNGGTIRSSTGTLNLSVTMTNLPVGGQTGTIEGTAGIDRLTFGGSASIALSTLTFASWTNGVDVITINGDSAANTLIGTTRNDIINGFDGADTLDGWSGGVDTINGGNGNDLIVADATNNGSFLSGGGDTDTLQILGGAVTLGSLSGFEVLQLFSNASLTLTSAQFNSGLAFNSTLGGTGTIFVNMSLGNQTVNARGMTVAPGSTLGMTINGTSGTDVIKASIGIATTISGGAGTDQLVGGGLGDFIIGGDDIDKIRGDGGADILNGGQGADVFKYRNVSDSGIGANADTITDFLSGTDRLNFSRIDADAVTPGDQAFTYVGTVAFLNNGIAQIRWVDLGADLRVEADINGDGVADMHILLQGAGAQVLTAADFVL